MSITKNNVIVVYIYNNLDSEEFANYYLSTHEMSSVNINPSESSGTTIQGIYWQVDGQKVGIQIENNSEILSESDFYKNVEEPLLEALNTFELSEERDVWGIILGYRIPGGYYYIEEPSIGEEEYIISATSRISRIKQTFSLKHPNKLYNRQIFNRFNAGDAELSLIVSRIDGPNLSFAKTIVDNAKTLNQQLFANGTFYTDPYSDLVSSEAVNYKEEILDFYNNMLPTLNLDTWSTTFMDPYIDSIIPFVENDSFVWSWFTDRSSSTFFRYSNALRVFFYNADYDGGYTIRDETSKRWCYLSLDAGYVATAGSLSNPSIDGFLNPNAFFYALLRGATIGEAFYFSLPYLDWTTSLFGDILTYCSFPASEVIDEDEIDEHEVWNIMSKDMARSAAYLFKKENELKSIVFEIVDIDSLDPLIGAIDAEMSLLYPANDLHVVNKESVWNSQLKPLVDTFFDFPRLRYNQIDNTINPNINDYLTDHNFKVSRILANITSEAIIEDDNLIDEGWWQFEFIVNDDDQNNFINYHFKMDISNNEDFTDIIISKDSYSIRNWTYEKEKNTFVPMTYSGVTSSYIGRKVRYESRQDPLIGLDEYLTRGVIYYFRITQYNLETSEEYSSRDYSDIIYS